MVTENKGDIKNVFLGSCLCKCVRQECHPRDKNQEEGQVLEGRP